MPRHTQVGQLFGVQFFITSNRRSRYVALIGHWPSRSGLAKSCRSGVRLFSRSVTVEEIEVNAESCRHVAIVFSALHVMVRYILETSDDNAREKLRNKFSDDGFRASYNLTRLKFVNNSNRWHKKKNKIMNVKEKNKELSSPQMMLDL